jgi:hypothetical protein
VVVHISVLGVEQGTDKNPAIVSLIKSSFSLFSLFSLVSAVVRKCRIAASRHFLMNSARSESQIYDSNSCMSSILS